LLVFLLGCDALWGRAIIPNPKFCGADPMVCGPGELCDPLTMGCLPILGMDLASSANAGQDLGASSDGGADQGSLSAPVILMTSPGGLSIGVPPATLQIIGTGFLPGVSVTLNGAKPASTIFMSSTNIATSGYSVAPSAPTAVLVVLNPDGGSDTKLISVN
jgi:hypothetical protein